MTYFKQILEQATISSALQYNKGVLAALLIVVICLFVKWAFNYSYESNDQRRERKMKVKS